MLVNRVETLAVAFLFQVDSSVAALQDSLGTFAPLTSMNVSRSTPVLTVGSASTSSDRTSKYICTVLYRFNNN